MRTYVNSALPAVTAWSSRYTHLREVVRVDVVTHLETLNGDARRTALCALRSLFGWARRTGTIFRNPTVQIGGPRREHAIWQPLTAAKIEAAIAAADTVQARVFVALTAVHAARPGRIRAMQLVDLDLAGRSLTIGGSTRPLDDLTYRVLLELRSSHPLLPMRVILDSNRGGAYLASLLVGVGMFGMFLFLAYYMQLVLGYSALASGVAFLPFTVGIILGAGVSSQLLPRIGPRVLMVTGLLLAAVGMVMLTRIGVDTGFWSHVFPAELVMSFGMGVVFGPMSNTALVGVSNHDAGVASAMINTTQQVGGSLGTALLNTIATSAAASYVTEHQAGAASPQALQISATVHSYVVAFWVSAGLIALAAIASAVMIRARRDQLAPTDGVPVHVG